MYQQISTSSAEKLLSLPPFVLSADSENVPAIMVMKVPFGECIGVKVEQGWMIDTDHLPKNSYYRKVTEKVVNIILSDDDTEGDLK